MDPADARRSASTMMRSSITLSFVGLLVGLNDERVDAAHVLADLDESSRRR